MSRYIFDIETDGLLDRLTKVHCLVLKDADSGEVKSFADQPGYTPIAEGVRMLADADEMIFHNGIKFDLPALQKVYPWFSPKATVWNGGVKDTLTTARLIWPEIKQEDLKFRAKNPSFPGNLIGRHSLEAWGWRLGLHKGDFGKSSDWSRWSPEMQAYCELDVEVTAKLYALLRKQKPSRRSITLEHQFQEVIRMMEEFGFPFDEAAAGRLYARLCQRRIELEGKLQEVFPPWIVGKKPITPARTITYKDPVRPSRVAGAPFTPISIVTFNPGSRDHISDRLMKLRGWKPVEFGADGKPTVDEDVLDTLPYPEAKPISEYLMVGKRIGQLAEGKNAWLKLVENGRIHGEVVTNGAVTGRCTHRNPNVAQVPSIQNAKGEVPYGRDCRSLFHAPPGFLQVGTDASGLELRCLAHFLAEYDGGAYARVLLEGDIHTANQEAAGLPTRANAKTFIYAFL